MWPLTFQQSENQFNPYHWIFRIKAGIQLKLRNIMYILDICNMQNSKNLQDDPTEHNNSHYPTLATHSFCKAHTFNDNSSQCSYLH